MEFLRSMYMDEYVPKTLHTHPYTYTYINTLLSYLRLRLGRIKLTDIITDSP